MAWTTPRTWVTSELVSSSIMNTHVRDNTQYLYDTTNPHIAASASVHGLPASVNVLGNRSAAGEFVQRGTFNKSADLGAIGSIYIGDQSVTFPVAFSSTPIVVCGIPTDSGNVGFSMGKAVTTTGFSQRISALVSATTITGFGWIALGA